MRKCKHEDGPRHDCAHVDAINKCIPEASRSATDAVMLAVKSEARLTETESRQLWDRVFHSEMDRITISNGLRRKAPRYDSQ